MSATPHVPRFAGWLAHRVFDRPLTARHAAWVIAVATTVVAAAAGLLMRVVEPDTYPNVWLGLWWSAQTVTSVGYGDLVPHSVAGRLLAVLVMIAGIALITIVVAMVSAALVEAARRRAEGRLIDDPVLDALRRVEGRLDAIEAELARGAESRGSAPRA
ncbi:MAG TPA: potassium channel family protein [Gaiellaceae bacterium]|nr:potassium channel family protein [Gaiellaceae bacterium]